VLVHERRVEPLTAPVGRVHPQDRVLEEHERLALGRAEEPGPVGGEPFVGGFGCEGEVGRAAFFFGRKQDFLDPRPARSGRCIR